MKTRENIVIFLLFSVLADTVHAATYHVAPGGNDANSGTSPGQAWQTLGRVNTAMPNLQPGDQVLFQRGGTWRGTLTIDRSGTAAQPIVFGAYGTGTAPVISGSIVVGNWSLYQGSIWVANVPQSVSHVYVNGDRMTLARYPNSGWLNMSSGTTTTITDPDLNQPTGYWNGARAVIRSNNWCYETPTVTTSSAGSLTHGAITHSPGNHSWGYFMCNKLTELDSPGEWYHDAGNGSLYLWAPGGADPNGLSVEAAVAQNGAILAWSRQYLRVQDLTFRHQTFAGIKNDGANYSTVTGCTFEDVYMAIRSYGSWNNYINNTVNRALATGMFIIDNNTGIVGNQLTDIAMVPGFGESTWGYFGIRTIGQNNTVSENVLENVGYSGIFLAGQAIVERNHIRNAVAILNDGGGIHFDDVNGLVVRDNVVVDLTGSLESTATNYPTYYKICHGIYFGCINIINTTIERNTVANGQASGIHVDHTMGSSGNQVKDNVLFNNRVQLSISDLSNNNGTGATPPFHVSNYNDVYSGNTMYSINKNDLCMLIYNVYGATPVDFGTFQNNRYHNPYEELCIKVHNTFSGAQKWYTLERWQVERAEDSGSTIGTMSLNDLATASVLSTDLVPNGEFNTNVSGWTFWPTNGQVTHSYTYLDNGAMRAHLPNASQYPELFLRTQDPFAVQNGQWYRLRFSIQSTGLGEVKAGAKGMTQMTSGLVIQERTYPFSSQRREVEYYFQSGLTDQALVQFVNHHTEPTYWLDNVQLHRVTVESVDPFEKQMILINDRLTSMDFPISGCWRDLDGGLHTALVTLPPMQSMILTREDEFLCGITTGMEAAASPAGSGSMTAYPNPATPGSTVRFFDPPAGSTVARFFDMRGQLVAIADMRPTNGYLVVPTELGTGAYVVELTGGDSSARSRLIVAR